MRIARPFLFIIFFLILWMRSVSADSPSVESLIKDLKNYFDSYYALIQEKNLIPPKENVFKQIQALSGQNLILNNFDDLSRSFDGYLKDYGKSINIFTINDSEIVNCWLGDLVAEKKDRRNVWGKEVDFTVKIIDNMVVRDFTDFVSQGKDALDIGTRDSIVYCNLEAYRIRANSIWDFFAERQKESKKRRYEPSRANRSRKYLYYKTWLNLYLNCIKENPNLDTAKSRFTEQEVAALKENSLFHEIGHIFADRYLALEDESKEETVAFLTELRYGNLVYDSLETIVAAAYQSQMNNYNLAGKEIISGFGIKQVQKIQDLFSLSENQVRLIAKEIYQQKIK